MLGQGSTIDKESASASVAVLYCSSRFRRRLDVVDPVARKRRGRSYFGRAVEELERGREDAIVTALEK